jgi:hypothetical protein
MADGLLEGRYAFFVGGYVDQSPPNLSQVDVLDVFTGAVAAGAPLPEARSAARASVVGARLFVMGGGVYNQEQMNPYDPRPDVWEFVPSP